MTLKKTNSKENKILDLLDSLLPRVLSTTYTTLRTGWGPIGGRQNARPIGGRSSCFMLQARRYKIAPILFRLVVIVSA